MSHYAKVENGTVVAVEVVDDSFFEQNRETRYTGTWIQTSYCTKEGKRVCGDNKPPLRGNFAGIGYSYDEKLDAFIPPKPYASWTLNTAKYKWEAPTPKPDGSYIWSEDTLSWEEY